MAVSVPAPLRGLLRLPAEHDTVQAALSLPAPHSQHHLWAGQGGLHIHQVLY